MHSLTSASSHISAHTSLQYVTFNSILFRSICVYAVQKEHSRNVRKIEKAWPPLHMVYNGLMGLVRLTPQLLLPNDYMAWRYTIFQHHASSLIYVATIMKKSDIPWICSDQISKSSNLMQEADIFWPINDLTVNISHCTHRCSRV